MPRYVAFLRAINVSGRFIKMEALAGHFRELGCQEVSTFLNSGNVVFRSPRPSVALAHFLEQQLELRLGFKSEVFLRTEAELRAIVAQVAAHLPGVPAGGELNVLLLGSPLTASQIGILSGLGTEMDRLVPGGQEVYWLCQRLQNQSKLANAVFERKLKMKTTLRRGTMLQTLCLRLSNGPP